MTPGTCIAPRVSLVAGLIVFVVAVAGCGGSSSTLLPCVPSDGGADLADDASDGSSDGSPDGASNVQCLPAAAALPAPGAGCTDSTPEFTTARPLGVGFPDGDDLLPAHVAYLTFDDGPSDWTGEILDTLAAEGVHATFFVNAKNLKGAAGLDGSYVDAAGNPAVFRNLLARAVDDGHALGNHTVDHLDLAALATAAAAAELDDNERLVNAALARAGRAPRPLTLIRPPFGSPWYHHAPLPPDQLAAEIAVADIVAARGIEVFWTIDSSDSGEWAQGESFTRRPNQITPDPAAPSYADKIARIESTVLTDPAVVAGAGAVILLHDTHNATRDALTAIIQGLRTAGYSFATVDDYATWRWSHPSADLTPGPTLYDACTPEGDWGCAFFGTSFGTSAADRDHAACGRFWRAFVGFGGDTVVGAPLAAPARRPSGTPYQTFANGVIELHPEAAAPCNVTFLPAR